MPNWKKEVNIKALMDEDEELQVVGPKIIALLKEHTEFEDVIQELQDAVDVDEVEDFDAALDGVYDIADRERIWMGL